jgi:CRISPR-associated endonuclease Cas1
MMARAKYFENIFSLFDESVRPKNRKSCQAYDGINNVFNLAYKALIWRVHVAIIRAKLEPYLGYLHAVAFGRPSLVCDMIEPYRYLMDNFVLENAREFRPKDFALKTEYFSKRRKGARANGDDACYFENKAYFTKRGLKKRNVIHELYHHLVFIKGLELSERIEEKQANIYAKKFLHFRF